MEFWMVLHRSRLLVACQLPKAERIVDLGGSSEGNPEGALLVYGYPYHFKSLSIVELPREARHELYTEICGEYDRPIQTPKAPSTRLRLDDRPLGLRRRHDRPGLRRAVDRARHDRQALTVIHEVHRVLKPGGYFCFDTPNRNVTHSGSPTRSSTTTSTSTRTKRCRVSSKATDSPWSRRRASCCWTTASDEGRFDEKRGDGPRPDLRRHRGLFPPLLQGAEGLTPRRVLRSRRVRRADRPRRTRTADPTRHLDPRVPKVLDSRGPDPDERSAQAVDLPVRHPARPNTVAAGHPAVGQGVSTRSNVQLDGGARFDLVLRRRHATTRSSRVSSKGTGRTRT